MRGIIVSFCLLVVFHLSVHAFPNVAFNGISSEVLADDVVCGEDDVFIPHHDCTKYYECDNFVPVPRDCAAPTFWNPRKDECDHQSEVPECIEGTRPPTGTTPRPTQAPTDSPTNLPTEAPTNLPTYIPTNPPVTEPTTTAKPICTDITIVENVPFPGNCSLYYLCAFGTPFLQSCGPKLLFDNIVRTCVREEVAVCLEEPTPEPPPETTRGPSVCRPGETYYEEVYGDCSRYTLCYDGQAIPQTCAAGTHFSPDAGKCVRIEDYACPWSPTSVPPQPTTVAPVEPTTVNRFPCPADPHIYVQHPDFCNLFYRCRNGEFGGIFQCGTDLWFHSELQGCVDPVDSDCPFGVTM